MGSLIQIALALGVLVAVEVGLHTGAEQPLAVLALAAVPHALAALGRRISLRGRMRTAELVQRALAASPIALFAVACAALGWPATVARWTGVEPSLLGWPHPALLLALAPFLAFALLAIDASARASGARPGDAHPLRRLQTRMLATSLGPLSLYVVAAWALGTNERVRAQLELVSLWSAAFALAFLALLVAALPWILRLTWDTSPMPRSAMRELLQSLAAQAGIGFRDLLVWNTGFQMANAAVVGVSARHRVVLLSDALMAQLGPRELFAVFAHEIGHVARHHVLVFLCWGVAYFVGLELAIERAFPGDDALAAASVAVGLALWYFGFGYLSRRTELDADLYAIELTRDPAAMVSALEKVGGPHARAKRSWRHFSTDERVRFLQVAAADPRRGRRLRGKLRAASVAGVALAVLALAYEAWSLWRAFPEENVRVELALGEPGAAAAWLRRSEEPDAELARLVELAGAAPYSRCEPTVLRDHGRAARERGELLLARDLLVLADLRRVPDLASEIAALERALRTGSR